MNMSGVASRAGMSGMANCGSQHGQKANASQQAGTDVPQGSESNKAKAVSLGTNLGQKLDIQA